MSASEMSTFTKWVTTEPKMAGVVGGAVGNGSYSGEILKDTTGPVEAIESLYRFHGSDHAFTALVHVEQAGLKANIIGVVIDGWHKGCQVKGEYTQTIHPQAPGDGTAFQGSLEILLG